MTRHLWSQRGSIPPVLLNAACAVLFAVWASVSAMMGRPWWVVAMWGWSSAMWLMSVVLSTSTAINNAETRGLLARWKQ